MPPKIDLTNQRFGRLRVIEQADKEHSYSGVVTWKCICDCQIGVDNPKYVYHKGTELRRGRIVSCGCLKRERIIQYNKTNNHKTNKYNLSGEYGIGWTSNTNQEFYFDLEDYDKIKDYCWTEHIMGEGYHRLEAWNPDTKTHIAMHTLLGFAWNDHIDRNPLNNRKGNLRECTRSQNAMNRSKQGNNTSGVTGVTWDKNSNKWDAFIKVEYQMIHIGLYSRKEDAIRARLEAEKEIKGEFSSQKHLYKKYGINEEE